MATALATVQAAVLKRPSRRLWPAALAALAVTVACAGLPAPARAQATTQVFAPEADAYVASADPGANYGAATRVHVDASPVLEGFMRFRVEGLDGVVEQAKLRLYAAAGTLNGPVVYAASNDWSESGVTWDTKPTAPGPALDNAGEIPTGTWKEFDVTSLVSGNGRYSFDLVAESSDGVDFVSRESSWPNKPQLVITTGPPETTIDSGPSGTTASISESFGFSSPHQAAGFECRLDGSLWEACSSPKNYVGLTPGGHTFEVRALDADGAADATPATRTWTIGVTATHTFLAEADTYAAAGSPDTNYGSATRVRVDHPPRMEGFVRFRVEGLSGVVTQAKLRLYAANSTPNGPVVYATSNQWSESGLTWATKPAPTSPALDNAGQVTANAWTEFDVSALVSENGSYSFDLVAESADGVDFMSRQSSSLRKPQLVITTEHMGPETTIESGPSGTTTSASAGFSFSSPGDLSASFQCRLDDGPWEGCVSPKQYSSLADGPHSFEVRARDGSGATDPMPARRDWTVDTESVLWAVGDGNAGSNSLATANRITGPLDALLYLGDVYETGTAEEFATNFDPVWGRFKSVTSPTPGNHDWTNLATGYDPYWGSRAPQTNGGHWYSFVEKGWEIISLNSEGESMAAGSAQWGWLRDRLASGGNCRIVFFHRPRYAAGLGEFPGSQAIWDLMANKVLFVLNGHAHSMQRSHPVNGVTEFISGGGGEGLTEADELDNRFAYVNDREFGSLKITLTRVGSNPDGGATAAHRFIAADDGSTLDSGSRTCTPSQ